MCSTEVRLVAERVGEALHREPRRDRVAIEVQLAMDLDELHRAAVTRENSERAIAQVTAPEGERVRGLRGDGGRPACARVSKTVHDVFRFDTGPHDEA